MPQRTKGPKGGSFSFSRPQGSSFKQQSAVDVQRSLSVMDSKMRPVTPQKQSKTPNKSGLTPVRPTKSPGTGVKLKSGLTPIKPTGLNVPHKSPFQQFERPKLKSGLKPIRPNGFDPKPPTSNDLDSTVSMGRRKSGIQPIRLGLGSQMFGHMTLGRPQMDFASHDNNVNQNKLFRVPSHPMSNNITESNNQSTFRRKSGLVPLKLPVCQKGATGREWKPRFSISNNPIVPPPVPASTQSRFNGNMMQASLKAISEDKESPTSFQSNLSGLAPLDDSEDMSVVIKHKRGQGSSRVPLPRASLSSSHFNTSDNTEVCRIPKRVLHFDDDDVTTSNKNVLRDGSSRMNVIQEKLKSLTIQDQSQTNTLNKQVTADDKREVLLKRKKEIEELMDKLNTELEEIKAQLTPTDDSKKLSLDDSENIMMKTLEDETDSPFANVNSPCTLDPLEFLPPEKSKRPENMYKLFRQSCSFLKTPQPSAFRKDLRHGARDMNNVPETPMNVSHRVQQQLAELFSDS